MWHDPVWGLPIVPTELERALLVQGEVVRLGGLAHHGPAGRLLGGHTTRLEHTLGVWSLCASLAPDDRVLRAAALLHDVGHMPFSHALEAIPGVDHHAHGLALVQAGAIGGLVARAGLDVAEVAATIAGTRASILRGPRGTLHLDHLDSFVRGARWRGTARLSPPRIAAALGLAPDGSPVVAVDAGLEIVRAVADEAAFHLSPVDVGADAWIAEATERALHDGRVQRAELPSLDDDALLARLARDPEARRELDDVTAGRLTFVAAAHRASARWSRTKRAAYLPVPRAASPADDAVLATAAEAAYGPFARDRTVAVTLAPTSTDAAAASAGPSDLAH